MKAWSIIGLLFAAAILATVPVSPQVTSRGVELSVGQAQAQTYPGRGQISWVRIRNAHSSTRLR